MCGKRTRERERERERKRERERERSDGFREIDDFIKRGSVAGELSIKSDDSADTRVR